MTNEPKSTLVEFGIDVDGKDPDGQYQWKMLSLRAGSEERKRLEKAWSAFVLGRKTVDLGTPAKPTASSAAPVGSRARSKKWWLAIVVIALAAAGYFVVMHPSEEHGAEQARPSKGDWQAKYISLKTVINESGHKDEHHEEFVLLAEAARSAIAAGQAPAMLDRMNADLLAEQDSTMLAKPITELEQHAEQWKVIVRALIMNKAELLDHAAFKGHHEGEL